MFLSTNQYPELKHFAKAERRALVAAAVKKEDPWINRRFFTVLLVVLLAPFLARLAFPNSSALLLQPIPAGLGGGLLFFGYLLWEVNGPMRKALIKFMHANPTAPQARSDATA